MSTSTGLAASPVTFTVPAPEVTVTQGFPSPSQPGHPIAWSILTQRVEDLQITITTIRDLAMQGNNEAIAAGQELYPRILVISENIAKVGADVAAALRTIRDIFAALAPGVGQPGQPKAPPQASGHFGQPVV